MSSAITAEVVVTSPSYPHSKAQPLANASKKSPSITYMVQFETIPSKLSERLDVGEAWLRCQVPAYFLQKNSFWRLKVDRFPSVRILDITDHDYYTVSIADSCFECLLDIGFPVCFEDWAAFYCQLEIAPDHIQHHFFELCASLAPSLNSRTNELWHKHFRKLCTADKRWKAKHADPLVLLHQLFESAGGKPMEITYTRHFNPEKRSVNDNLADLRRLFDSNCTDVQAFNQLNAEDRITLYVPIGFPSMVYDALPASLINILPLEIVKGAQYLIWKVQDEMPWIQESTSCFSLLLYHCVLQNLPGQCRDWMASPKGEAERCRALHSLNKPASAESLALSLTTLCIFEQHSMEADQAHESQIAVYGSCWNEFINEMRGHKSKVRPNLWHMVGASFKKVWMKKRSGDEMRHNYYPIVCLETVLHDLQTADQLVEDFWDGNWQQMLSSWMTIAITCRNKHEQRANSSGIHQVIN
ncbi:hypothetical protein DER44DRAFT_807348 [Fusarium oxysporum]|nr:hypothetical protein DER44DRAFT_807348 [Fusarium oxysporum]